MQVYFVNSRVQNKKSSLSLSKKLSYIFFDKTRNNFPCFKIILDSLERVGVSQITSENVFANKL